MSEGCGNAPSDVQWTTHYLTDEEMREFSGRIGITPREEPTAVRCFSTGSVRDRRDGKGRFDLIPPEPLKRLALRYEYGINQGYGERNWEKGQPLMSYIDSLERHINDLKSGGDVEDHAAAILWNACGYMQTLKWIEDGALPAELDDRPHWMK